MNETVKLREAVGCFDSRKALESAIKALTDGGFQSSDLSLLSSHESLAAADQQKDRITELFSALGNDLRYLAPLTAAGFIMLTAGPVAGALSAVIAAGIGTLAAREILEEAAATPHSADFARALEAGSIILWVRVNTPAQEKKALEILSRCGGQNVHMNERAPA